MICGAVSRCWLEHGRMQLRRFVLVEFEGGRKGERFGLPWFMEICAGSLQAGVKKR